MGPSPPSAWKALLSSEDTIRGLAMGLGFGAKLVAAVTKREGLKTP
jgi:hypothetical protein